MALNAIHLRRALSLNAIRLRRALSLSSTFLNRHRFLSTTSNSSFSSLLQNPLNSSSTTYSTSPSFSRRFFHSSHLSLSSSRNFNDFDKIDPDTILFEGCDYKHWLIVMDFGKDPKLHPSPQEMVETYVQTLAKVVGSVEEAKKRMYACSTTTYTGFQALMDEETSQKFEGMPGVIFVLPDSYIDPVNMEYGGDKYINGTIIPRPPPVQYGRVKRHGSNERRPMRNSMPGEGRGYMPQGGNLEQQNTPGQEGRGYPMSNRTNYSEQGKDGYQGGRNSYVPPQGGRNTYVPQQGGGNTYVPDERGYNHPQGHMRDYLSNHGGYTSQGPIQYPNDARNYTPPTAGQYGPGPSGNSAQGTSIRYGPEYASQAENQRFSQTPDEQNSMSTEHKNYTPAMQTGLDQSKF